MTGAIKHDFLGPSHYDHTLKRWVRYGIHFSIQIENPAIGMAHMEKRWREKIHEMAEGYAKEREGHL